MKETKQIHEKFPVWFLDDFVRAGQYLRDSFIKDVDKCISSVGGKISLTKLANKLRDSTDQEKTNRAWTIKDNWVFESVLEEMGYKINKEYDKKGQLKVTFVSR